MELPAVIQKQVERIFDQNEEFYNKKDFKTCIALSEQAWGLFPEPKYAYFNEGYSLVEGLVDLNLKVGNLETAKQWAENLFQFNPTYFFGTSEFALGKVYYSMNNDEAAKEQFLVAMQKSQGRVFEGEDKKYINLLKKK